MFINCKTKRGTNRYGGIIMGGGSDGYVSSRVYDFDDKPSTTSKTAKDYAKVDKRDAVKDPVQAQLPLGIELVSNSIYPAALILDFTGSMKRTHIDIIDKFHTV